MTTTTDIALLTPQGMADLTADELDKKISFASTTDDKPVLHALAEERLSRHEFMSGVSRRMGLINQCLDLDLIRKHETWRLGHYESFFAYLAERKAEYERQGYDSDGDILVVKGYSTVLAWANIISHYHERHGITLELLSYVPKGKLETVSGVCNRWDAAHGDEMDGDVRDLLFDTSVTKDDILSLYAERKRRQGVEMIVSDDGGNLIPEPEPEHEPVDGGEGSGEREPVTAEDELDITMETETGRLTAWQKHGTGHVPLEIGFLNVKHHKTIDLVLNLCKTWGIRLK